MIDKFYGFQLGICIRFKIFTRVVVMLESTGVSASLRPSVCPSFSPLHFCFGNEYRYVHSNFSNSNLNIYFVYYVGCSFAIRCFEFYVIVLSLTPTPTVQTCTHLSVRIGSLYLACNCPIRYASSCVQRQYALYASITTPRFQYWCLLHIITLQTGVSRPSSDVYK